MSDIARFLDTEWTFTFEPIAKWSEEDQTFYPTVKVKRNGEFVEWREFIIGLDEATAHTFARSFARGMSREYQVGFDRFKKDHPHD